MCFLSSLLSGFSGVLRREENFPTAFESLAQSALPLTFRRMTKFEIRISSTRRQNSHQKPPVLQTENKRDCDLKRPRYETALPGIGREPSLATFVWNGNDIHKKKLGISKRRPFISTPSASSSHLFAAVRRSVASSFAVVPGEKGVSE